MSRYDEFKGKPLPERVEKAASATVDSSFKIHTRLGPGLQECIYEESLAYDLRNKGYNVKTQFYAPMKFEEAKLPRDVRIDMIVDDCLIVELKAVKELHPYFRSQVLTYLEVTGIRLGLLINFGMPRLKNNIKRIIR